VNWADFSASQGALQAGISADSPSAGGQMFIGPFLRAIDPLIHRPQVAAQVGGIERMAICGAGRDAATATGRVGRETPVQRAFCVFREKFEAF
jgi:hypothetical protein